MSFIVPRRPRNHGGPPHASNVIGDDARRPRVETYSSEDGWQAAVASHINTLTPEQARDFRAPASLQECLDILTRASMRTSRFSNLLQLFRPVIGPLKRFEGALDVVVQVNSGIASPIWGPLKAAITIAHDHFKTLESLAMLIYRILSSIERYSNYERLFAEDPGVQRAIGDLYGDLIDFCSRIIRFHSRHFRSVFVTFDHEFGLVADLVAFHSSQVDLAANAAHMVQTKDAQEASMSMQEIQERTSILHWLSSVNVEDDLTKFSQTRTPGSCDFVLNAPWFRTLIDVTKPCNCCLVGPPGYGKTILSAFIISQLQSMSGSPTLYFFCRAEDQERELVLPALRTMLTQLCLLDDNAFGAVKGSFRQRGQLAVDSVISISELLTKAANSSKFDSIVAVVDALDECKDSKQLIEVLTHSMGERLRLLATSREIVPSTVEGFNLLRPFKTLVRLNLQSTSRPVEAYIKKRAENLSQLREIDNPSSLIAGLIEAAGGLWLAAKLLMDEVSRATSIKSIIELIRYGPSGLAKLYDGILRNREASLSHDEIRLAAQILLWLDLDDYMSSSVSLDSDAISLKTVRIAMQSANYGEPVLDGISLISHVCCPLVEVDLAPYASTVDFVHLSAFQHVQQARNRNAADLCQILRPQRLRQLHRAKAATWYLSSSSDFDEVLMLLQRTAEITNDPQSCASDFMSPQYLNFAYGLWSLLKLRGLPVDLDEAELTEVNVLLQSVMNFLTSHDCIKWIRFALLLNINGGWVSILAKNVIETLNAAYSSVTYQHFSTWQEFNRVRVYFFENYLSILYDTAERDSTTRAELKDMYLQICGKKPIPPQYRLENDAQFTKAPLKEISNEAAYWQEQVRVKSENDEISKERVLFALQT